MPKLYEEMIKQAADDLLTQPILTKEVGTTMSDVATLRKQAAGILALAHMMQDEKLAAEAAETTAEIVKLAESGEDEDFAQALDLLEQIADQTYEDDAIAQIEDGEADGEIDGDLASLASVVTADELEKMAGVEVRGLSKLASQARTALRKAAAEANVVSVHPFVSLRKQAAGILVLADAMQNEKLAAEAIESIGEIAKLAESEDEDEQAEALELLEQIADGALGEEVDDVGAGEADAEIAEGLASLASVDAADTLEKVAGEGGRSLAKLASQAFGAMQKVAMYKVAAEEAVMTAGLALGAVSGVNEIEDADLAKAANAMEMAALAKEAAAEMFIEAEMAEDELFGQEKTASMGKYVASLGRHARKLKGRTREFVKDVAGRKRELKTLADRAGGQTGPMTRFNKFVKGGGRVGTAGRSQAKDSVAAFRLHERVRKARMKAGAGAAAGALALGTGAFGAAKGRHKSASEEAVTMNDIEMLKVAAVQLWKEADLIEEAAGELLVPDEQLELLEGPDDEVEETEGFEDDLESEDQE